MRPTNPTAFCDNALAKPKSADPTAMTRSGAWIPIQRHNTWTQCFLCTQRRWVGIEEYDPQDSPAESRGGDTAAIPWNGFESVRSCATMSTVSSFPRRPPRAGRLATNSTRLESISLRFGHSQSSRRQGVLPRSLEKQGRESSADSDQEQSVLQGAAAQKSRCGARAETYVVSDHPICARGESPPL